MEESKSDLMDRAARLALESRRKGFHCSESVFLAINGILDIIDPCMVRAVTGFHGGGGAHRKELNVNLNAVLEEVASGRDRRPLEELPIAVTGHLCGALASGIVCIGLLFGRREATDDLTCVDELSYELHRRFEAKFGCKTCRELREKYVPLSANNTCEYIYQEGARMAVELILEAPGLVDRCPKEG
jgi:C_GCAxxG_C_C family probable redox protein